jgi:hypothetical protein
MDRTNKHGARVAVGQIWRDLDKRMTGRHCRVIGFDANDRALMLRVDCDTGIRLGDASPTRVSIDRMRPMHNGWELVREPASLPQRVA